MMIPARRLRIQNGVYIFEVSTTGSQSFIPIHWDTLDSDQTDVFLVTFFFNVHRTHHPNRPLSRLVLVPTEGTRGQYRRVGFIQEKYKSDWDLIDEEKHEFVRFDLLSDNIPNRAADEAFTGFIDHGDEKWGIIEII
jgi:hypothetical protein